MYEMAYLRRQDVSLDDRTLTITETPAHKPKNHPSWRTIPVCDRVIDILADWIDNMKIQHPDGFLFFPDPKKNNSHKRERASRVGCWSTHRVTDIWRLTLKKAPDELTLPPTFVPRKLRATFATLMRDAGADMWDLQRYLGHMPAGNVLMAHYDHPSEDRLRKIAEMAQGVAGQM